MSIDPIVELCARKCEELRVHNDYSEHIVKEACADAIRAITPAELAAVGKREAVNRISIPLQDALNEPCKGCGKRPIDFVSCGGLIEYAAPVAPEGKDK